jgi:hypothetical protein
VRHGPGCIHQLDGVALITKAHPSEGSDDRGLVLCVSSVNPHSSLKIDVKNTDGTNTGWTFTGGSVQVPGRRRSKMNNSRAPHHTELYDSR